MKGADQQAVRLPLSLSGSLYSHTYSSRFSHGPTKFELRLSQLAQIKRCNVLFLSFSFHVLPYWSGIKLCVTQCTI